MKIFCSIESADMAAPALKVSIVLVVVVAAGSGLLFGADPLVKRVAAFDFIVSMPARITSL